MKKAITLISFILLCLFTFGQANDVVVFSEKGDKFYLYVNGVQQNDVAQSNVRGADITTDRFHVRVVFENSSMPELSQNFWTEETNVQISARITENRRGSMVIRFDGEGPKTAVAESTTTGQATYEDPHREQREKPHETQQPGTVDIRMDVSVDESYSEDISIDMGFTETEFGDESVSIDIQVSESGARVNAGTKEESVQLDMHFSEDEVRVNTGTGKEGVDFRMQVNPGTAKPEREYYFEETVIETEETYESQTTGLVSTTACPYPMTKADFDDASKSVKGRSFEDGKLTVAKQISKNQCMTSEQVRDIMTLFSFEETKLEFAKYAWEYVYNPENYYKVNDSFTFEMTIDELQEFLESK